MSDLLVPVAGNGESASPPPPPLPPRRRAPRRGFRRRGALDQHSLHFGPNMTPMVDIVLVILIFFMATAAFMGSEWFLRAAIPFQAGRGTNATKPNDPLAPPPTRMDVVLDVDATTSQTVVSFLGFARVSMEQFERQIASFPEGEATRNIQVLIKPTRAVPYRDIVRTHAACDAKGISKVGYGVSAN